MQLGSWEDNEPSVIQWDTDLGRERQKWMAVHPLRV